MHAQKSVIDYRIGSDLPAQEGKKIRHPDLGFGDQDV
jgi:hypothetical protein